MAERENKLFRKICKHYVGDVIALKEVTNSIVGVIRF